MVKLLELVMLNLKEVQKASSFIISNWRIGLQLAIQIMMVYWVKAILGLFLKL
jgi:hypothetical protein